MSEDRTSRERDYGLLLNSWAHDVVGPAESDLLQGKIGQRSARSTINRNLLVRPPPLRVSPPPDWKKDDIDRVDKVESLLHRLEDEQRIRLLVGLGLRPGSLLQASCYELRSALSLHRGGTYTKYQRIPGIPGGKLYDPLRTEVHEALERELVNLLKSRGCS